MGFGDLGRAALLRPRGLDATWRGSDQPALPEAHVAGAAADDVTVKGETERGCDLHRLLSHRNVRPRGIGIAGPMVMDRSLFENHPAVIAAGAKRPYNTSSTSGILRSKRRPRKSLSTFCSLCVDRVSRATGRSGGQSSSLRLRLTGELENYSALGCFGLNESPAQITIVTPRAIAAWQNRRAMSHKLPPP